MELPVDRIYLQKSANNQVSSIPTYPRPDGIVKVDVAFLHLTGVGVVGWVSTLGVPRRAPGVVEGFTDKRTRTIRHRADASQLIAIQVAQHAIILHCNPLPISVMEKYH